MLYFIHGTDREKTQAKAHEILTILKKKRPDATVSSVSPDLVMKGGLDELAGEQGLFESKVIVFLDGVCEENSHKEKILELSPLWKMSQNAFVILEGKVSKEVEKTISSNAEKTFVFNSVIEKEYSVFPLADAVGLRDRKSSWVKFREAIEKEIPAEEIHGVLFWQIKSMILAGGSDLAEKTGLSPFVYSKSRRYAKNFKKEELEELVRKLVSMYHDAHRGETDLAIELEKFVLGL